MNACNCPEHGNLVLDLARGRLDDRRAEEAETALRDCAVCGRWFSDAFAGAAVTAVDSAVAEVFESFVPPKRRRHGWLAAAAAAVLAIGLGTSALLWHNAETAQPGPASASTAGAVLSTWDFEDGRLDAAATPATDTPTPGDQTSGEAAVFVSSLESGDLTNWSSHS